MSAKRVNAAAFALGMSVVLVSSYSVADIWVFEPSLTLDQRLDDNYYLVPIDAGSLSATRAIGEVGLSREDQNYVLKGLARVDALLTTNTEVGDESLDSNQIFAVNYTQITERSRYGIRLDYKQDTPSRDIAADISDESSEAEDTGLVITRSSSGEITQSLLNNVPRKEFIIEPSFVYDLTRRLAFEAKATYTDVDHERADPQDIIYQRYLDVRRLTNSTDPLLSYDEVTIETVGVFTVDGELDDFQEAELELGLRYKLSPITTTSAKLAHSRLRSNVDLPEDRVEFDDKIPDSDIREILRNPRVDVDSTTTRLTLGYERFLTPTLQWSFEIGAYTSETENLVSGDLVSDVNSLANTTLSYDAGATKYKVRFAVDIQPSSAGSQVETNELTGELKRVLSPRLNFAFNARAFEPDRFGVRSEDRFARRFISFQPRIEWKYTRNWTVSAAYRYRRQKAQVDPAAAESNAVLFAIKYTPPSEIRDVARERGL